MTFPTDSVILTVDEMTRADAAAIAAGIPGEQLMEAAGTAVAEAIRARWPRGAVCVLCGPGNNGGDGFVIARLLDAAGWTVRVALLGARENLRGDAALNAGRWRGPVEPVTPAVLEGADLVVDALFGAGLDRPLDGAAREVIEAIGRSSLACVAVDLPSGVQGDTGAVLGAAARAALTVTFCRPKPAHLLYPGRALCGALEVADIGIPEAVLQRIRPNQAANGPDLWRDRFPWPRPMDHKYTRGHVLIIGGAEMTGAARLATQAARRVGAGMATVLCPPAAADIYRIALTGALVATIPDVASFVRRVGDSRTAAVLVGPGNGMSPETREHALRALASGRPTVLDADALSVFSDKPGEMFGAIAGPCLLSPHDGEFARLFGDLDPAAGKLARVRAAATRAGAVVLLKGADTVIAAPDGRAVVNRNAPPTLATAGTGDVLSGLAVGLMGQGMAVFEAACCATWLQGEAARRFGAGLIAEDLSEAIPGVLAALSADSASIV